MWLQQASRSLLGFDRRLSMKYRQQSKRMLETVLAMAADIFRVPISDLSVSSSPETIEAWDSLNHLALVLAIEQEFMIQLSPEEIETLISLERIVAVVRTKLRYSSVQATNGDPNVT